MLYLLHEAIMFTVQKLNAIIEIWQKDFLLHAVAVNMITHVKTFTSFNRVLNSSFNH